MYTEYWTCGSRDEPEGLTLATRLMNDDGTPAISYGDPSGWYKPNQITEAEYNALRQEMDNQPLDGVNSYGLISPAQRERSRIAQQEHVIALWERINAGKISLAKQMAAVLGNNAADVLVGLEPKAPAETLDKLRNGQL